MLHLAAKMCIATVVLWLMSMMNSTSQWHLPECELLQTSNTSNCGNKAAMRQKDSDRLQVTLPPGSPDPASQLLGAAAPPAADPAAFSSPNLAAAQLPPEPATGATAGPLPNPAVAAAAAAADARPRAASPGPLHNSPLAKAHAPGGAPLTGHARQAR
jgi:hypothetical protein